MTTGENACHLTLDPMGPGSPWPAPLCGTEEKRIAVLRRDAFARAMEHPKHRPALCAKCAEMA